MQQKKVGVILSGCGYLDGAEIQEAVLTLLALDRADVQVTCMAPNRQQMHVVDHLLGKPTDESRNVLVEAARIARGNIVDIASIDTSTLDALALPGGYGGAKNLSDFAVQGAACTVDPQVTRVIREIHAAGKPIASLCITPTILAALFGKELQPLLTIGNDADTAAALEQMGATHQRDAVTDIVIDDANNLVSTPCYMLDARIRDVAKGIDRAIEELLQRAERGAART
jgi:enhancing lycopene biosynthesis protein 2